LLFELQEDWRRLFLDMTTSSVGKRRHDIALNINFGHVMNLQLKDL
jgi:hypothetical protein